MRHSCAICMLIIWSLQAAASAEDARQFSGIYPHLAMFNQGGECGTGAVVPWADRLWVVTYSPHAPTGSSDKLFEVTSDLQQIIRPESIGGTPANRMIHEESQQLFIGPYAIRQTGEVRVIPYSEMFGRPTGNARHLFEPTKKIYSASMEEALYEIDVETLKVVELWADEAKKSGRHSNLPGYHGKGLATGYGRLIYANNGEHGQPAREDPTVPSGVLAEWNGRDSSWNVVSRNQFTEVTTPDGILGNLRPDSNPVWALGWDHRSLILMCLHNGEWTRYRLVKASHSYDGAHGWNTEWPRIRDIGENDLLMTMHGAFWKFPKDFQPGSTSGIRQRSSYLKIIGDFCRWNEQVVFGCDDAAQKEFLNTRRAKGKLAGPAASQSNLWFLPPSQLDQLGPVGGNGAVWINDAVQSNIASDPMHTGGFKQCVLFLSHDSPTPAQFTIEEDRSGTGQWRKLLDVTIKSGDGEWRTLSNLSSEWLRIIPQQSSSKTTAQFSFPLQSQHSEQKQLFAGFAPTGPEAIIGGFVRAGDQETGLQILSQELRSASPQTGNYYELNSDLNLIPVSSDDKLKFMREEVSINHHPLVIDGNSVLYVDDDGERYRLPIGNNWFKDHPEALGTQRVAREVCTERDLFQCAGTFYELPARNAGGFRRIRPICTHELFIQDYCSWRGMLVLTGLLSNPQINNEHIIRSADNQAAVWLGCIDDLWKMGSPHGRGGPWSQTAVHAGDVSDPYLLSGFHEKFLRIESTSPTHIQVECDVLGIGQWSKMGEISITPVKGSSGTQANELQMQWEDGTAPQKATLDSNDWIQLPSSLDGASWIRFRSTDDTTVSITLDYRS